MIDTTLQPLAARAETILTEFETRLTALGISVPCRVYVAPGQQIPIDDEQLVVNLQGIGQGQPGAPNDQTYFVGAALNLQATFTISLWRRIPALSGDGSISAMTPPVADLDTAGRSCVQDAGAMIQVATDMMRDNAVTDTGSQFVIGELVPLGPEGGYAGVSLPIMLAVY